MVSLWYYWPAFDMSISAPYPLLCGCPGWWLCRWEGSLAYIQQLIGSSRTSCIRLQDGSPVAWMLEVRAGTAPGMVQCTQAWL